MMLGIFKSALKPEPTPIDRRQSLGGIPALNPGVSLKEIRAGVFEVAIPMKRGPGFWARFQPARWERRVQLDALGAFVIQQIDGRSNTLQITEAFIAQYKVNRREAELCTVAFLKSLLERNIISIGIVDTSLKQKVRA
jgi:hypothetical protein